MKFSYHITFGNGSNPYHCFPVEKAELKKSIRKWIGNTPFLAVNRFDIWPDSHKYRIANSEWGTWYLYNDISHEILGGYEKLGNALNRLESIIKTEV